MWKHHTFVYTSKYNVGEGATAHRRGKTLQTTHRMWDHAPKCATTPQRNGKILKTQLAKSSHGPSRYFSKEETRMANKHVKRCPRRQAWGCAGHRARRQGAGLGGRAVGWHLDLRRAASERRDARVLVHERPVCVAHHGGPDAPRRLPGYQDVSLSGKSGERTGSSKAAPGPGDPTARRAPRTHRLRSSRGRTVQHARSAERCPSTCPCPLYALTAQDQGSRPSRTRHSRAQKRRVTRDPSKGPEGVTASPAAGLPLPTPGDSEDAGWPPAPRPPQPDGLRHARGPPPSTTAPSVHHALTWWLPATLGAGRPPLVWNRQARLSRPPSRRACTLTSHRDPTTLWP